MHRLISHRGLDPDSLTERVRNELAESADRIWSQASDGRDLRKSRLRTIARKFDEFATEFATWHWTLSSTNGVRQQAGHDTGGDCWLITADAPVATISFEPGGWHGILPEGSPLFMPVSPTHLLIAEKHPLGEPLERVTPELAWLVNRRLSAEAYESIFVHPSLEWPADLSFARERPTLPTPTVTWGRSAPEVQPTFPAKYPPLRDLTVAALLKTLGAVDTVN